MNYMMLLGYAVLLTACTQPALNGQDNPDLDNYQAYWQRMEAQFRGPGSPLLPEARAGFDSIARYPFAQAYRVAAVYTPIADGALIKVATTTEAVRNMQVVGLLEFELEGKQHQLPLYRDLSMARKPMAQMAPYFLPFTDLSNGKTTYAGGRYLELDRELVAADTVVVDFNLAYNPYCVYNPKYSCPVPPFENHVDAVIAAGARVE